MLPCVERLPHGLEHFHLLRTIFILGENFRQRAIVIQQRRKRIQVNGPDVTARFQRRVDFLIFGEQRAGRIAAALGGQLRTDAAAEALALADVVRVAEKVDRTPLDALSQLHKLLQHLLRQLRGAAHQRHKKRVRHHRVVERAVRLLRQIDRQLTDEVRQTVTPGVRHQNAGEVEGID